MYTICPFKSKTIRLSSKKIRWLIEDIFYFTNVFFRNAQAFETAIIATTVPDNRTGNNLVCKPCL